MPDVLWFCSHDDLWKHFFSFFSIPYLTSIYISYYKSSIVIHKLKKYTSREVSSILQKIIYKEKSLKSAIKK